jgi:hypothetical protein
MSGTFRGDLKTLFDDAADAVRRLPPERRAQLQAAGRVAGADMAAGMRHSALGVSVCSTGETDLCASVLDMCAEQEGPACQALSELCDAGGIRATSRSCLKARQPVCAHLTRACARSGSNKLCPMVAKLCAQ